MTKRSAGLLVFRYASDGSIEVFLVHPGGPFWHNKDEGVWSLPKGEIEPLEDPLAVARREFAEETGSPVPEGGLIDLGEIRQSNGKRVRGWAVRGNVDATAVISNTFEMEWPRKSGQVRSFPEVDRGEWFSTELARKKLVHGQGTLIDRLLSALSDSPRQSG